MWVDTHQHVADAQFDADRLDVLQRARDAGVETLIEIAESPASWEAALALAERYPFVYAALGIHPHHAHEVSAADWPSTGKRLRELLQHPRAVAVGEFGLDYFRMQNSKEQQDFLFHAQLDLARELGKPVVIHCREAHADTRRILAEYFPPHFSAIACPRPSGVIHCFAGEWADAQDYLMRGFLVGIDAPLTYPSAKLLRENVLRLPLERMVLETDSPYLPPQTHRGQRNEPFHIPLIGEAIAAIKHKATPEVARQTTLNAKALFRI